MGFVRQALNCFVDLVALSRTLVANGLRFLALCTKSRPALAAEILFLRKQLAFYQERKTVPRRFDNASRYLLVLLARWFDWRGALVNVKPKTLIAWHRTGFRLFWRWKCRRGRPRIPAELRTLIRQMAQDNISWGEQRIANELLLKLGIQISPRTVRKYMPKHPPGRRHSDQRWLTFLHNHGEAIVACDFLTVVTAPFQWLYVFVIMDLGTRKLLHIHVTDHPTANWTLQQLREAIPSDHLYQYLLHDRDNIFSADLDASMKRFGLRVLKTPYRSPMANSICERVIGSLRRECLDFLIPLTKAHLLRVVQEWSTYYNTARPHMSLGPGIPGPPDALPVTIREHRHQLPTKLVVSARPFLGGLHHDYWLEPVSA